MSWKDNLVVGVQHLPPRICIHGTHGIGKSTLASKFPKPIFISTEDGLASLDVTSFPRAATIDDVVTNIMTLLKEEHDFKTVVIDSIDWLVAPLIANDINAKYDEKAQAYGKGQVMVAESFREILGGLDALRTRRGMNVVLIAHTAVTKFDSPLTESYDRYVPKLPNRTNDILQEWCDVLMYAGLRIIIKKEDAGYGNKTNKGITTGERLLYLTETPAYVAKNRYACPESIPMTIEALEKVIPIQK